MKVVQTRQPSGPPIDKPLIERPCVATLGVATYYYTERGAIPSNRGIVCSATFAETVLAALEAWAKRYHFAIVHIGVYNPRKARHMDGTPIIPPRWSGHARGMGIDWKGVIESGGAGKFLTTGQLASDAPAKYQEIMHAMRVAIERVSLRPEIVEEGGSWVHAGIYHK